MRCLGDPAAGATGVDPGTRSAKQFTEPVDPRTLTPNAFRLTSPGGPIAGSLGTGEQGLLAFLTPSTPLSFGATYTVR